MSASLTLPQSHQQTVEQEFAPQPGPQTQFLSTRADIAVYGGAAGGGKTWALLMEPLRHIHNGNFGAVIFRRTFPQIKNEGGLWDEAYKMYPLFGGQPKESYYEWVFPSGAKVGMRHLQHEKNKLEFQGAQIAFTGWDELTHFTEGQFFYLLSRGRSLSGVKPYVRATCNPDAGSWVKNFLSPWIDSKSSFKAQSNELLWMYRDSSSFYWWRDDLRATMFDDPNQMTLLEAKAKYPNRMKTITFIASTIYDNKILLDTNPEYLGNLESLPMVEKRRLLYGDWDIKEGDQLFKKEWFEVLKDHEIPYENITHKVRYWDLAATTKYEDKRACYTAGVLAGIDETTRIVYILDVVRTRSRAIDVEALVRQTARTDGKDTEIVMEQEPGASGKQVIDSYARLLLGYIFRGDRPTGKKETRAKPLVTSASKGHVKMRYAPWNLAFLEEIEMYPLGYKDQTDACSGSFNELAVYNEFYLV